MVEVVVVRTKHDTVVWYCQLLVLVVGGNNNSTTLSICGSVDDGVLQKLTTCHAPLVESLNDVGLHQLNPVELITKCCPVGLHIVSAAKQFELTRPRRKAFNKTVDLV